MAFLAGHHTPPSQPMMTRELRNILAKEQLRIYMGADWHVINVPSHRHQISANLKSAVWTLTRLGMFVVLASVGVVALQPRPRLQAMR